MTPKAFSIRKEWFFLVLAAIAGALFFVRLNHLWPLADMPLIFDRTAAVEQARKKFIEHMEDDLNAPRSIAAIHDLATEVNRLIDSGELSHAGAEAVLGLMDEVDSVLGIFFEAGEKTLTAEQESLIESRTLARTQKNWAEADRIRDLLLEQGIEVKDTPDGVRWTYLG